jgi:pyruvate kinase
MFTNGKGNIIKMSIKKTKIIVTIGPASRSQKVIEELINNGANVFRLNFSHGSHEDHAETIANINAAAKKLNVFPGILADLQGPKIRTGLTAADEPVTLKAGHKIIITTKKIECTDKALCIDYPGILNDVCIGEEILINDGAIRLKVESIDKEQKQVTCRVLAEGSYSSHKGVNFPNAKLNVPSFTEKDKKDLDFILTQNVQFIALSFVRNKADILPLASIIKKSGKHIKLIIKIEKPEAEKNLDEILDVCDGVMVARGDLGIETSPYIVPLLQKHIISKTNERGNIVIVATQMLESMINNAMPTRAESTDVANAIIDDTDALMLSGETAIGKYPGLCVDTMTKIAMMTEESSYPNKEVRNLSCYSKIIPHAMCEAAAWASKDLNYIPVIVFTMSGNTAFYLSKIRNQSPIFAFSSSLQVAAQCSLFWNTKGFYLPFNNNIMELQKQAEEKLIEKKLVKKGSLIIVISGTTPVKGATNFVRVKKVGED